MAARPRAMNPSVTPEAWPVIPNVQRAPAVTGALAAGWGRMMDVWRETLAAPAGIMGRVAAGMCITYGIWLLLPFETLQSSTTLAVLARVFPETNIGLLFLLTGAGGGLAIWRGYVRFWRVFLLAQGALLLFWAVILAWGNLASGAFNVYGWLGLGAWLAWWSLGGDATEAPAHDHRH